MILIVLFVPGQGALLPPDLRKGGLPIEYIRSAAALLGIHLNSLPDSFPIYIKKAGIISIYKVCVILLRDFIKLL